jgi:hypothetical protein
LLLLILKMLLQLSNPPAPDKRGAIAGRFGICLTMQRTGGMRLGWRSLQAPLGAHVASKAPTVSLGLDRPLILAVLNCRVDIIYLQEQQQFHRLKSYKFGNLAIRATFKKAHMRRLCRELCQTHSAVHRIA